MEFSLQDLCFALEQRGHGDVGGGQDPRVPANLCEITPTSPIDCAVVANLCLPGSHAQTVCEATGREAAVQANVGQQEMGRFAQVIPGTVAYLPCPSPAMAMRLLELQHGCCPHHDQVEHHHHRTHGCHCGTDPCTC